MGLFIGFMHFLGCEGIFWRIFVQKTFQFQFFWILCRIEVCFIFKFVSNPMLFQFPFGLNSNFFQIQSNLIKLFQFQLASISNRFQIQFWFIQNVFYFQFLFNSDISHLLLLRILENPLKPYTIRAQTPFQLLKILKIDRHQFRENFNLK